MYRKTSSRYNRHPFTEAGVIARLRETGKAYDRRKLADQFHVSTPEMREVLDRLVEKELIKTVSQFSSVMYFVPKEQEPEPMPEGVAGYRVPVRPFRPLVGYETRMREFAERRGYVECELREVQIKSPGTKTGAK